MILLKSSASSVPDIDRLHQRGDIPALIRLLGNKDPSVQWHAAEALGTLGSRATPLLSGALHSTNPMIRLGAVEAFSTIRDTGSVEPLIGIMFHDPILEVRWAAALALGEIGSPRAIPSLVRVLRDDSRYLRYGAAQALSRLDWQPDNETDRIYLLIARGDWDSVRNYGAAATLPLMEIFRDQDPATRSAIVSILGEIGDTHSKTACPTALRDRDPTVRWKAVLASMNCGVASSQLPLMLARRERTGPNPLAAALLNFLFLGIGYNYLGRWWGFPVFMAYMSVIVLAQLAIGPFIPYLIAYPFTAIVAVHTYYLAQRMPDSV